MGPRRQHKWCHSPGSGAKGKAVMYMQDRGRNELLREEAVRGPWEPHRWCQRRRSRDNSGRCGAILVFFQTLGHRTWAKPAPQHMGVLGKLPKPCLTCSSSSSVCSSSGSAGEGMPQDCSECSFTQNLQRGCK